MPHKTTTTVREHTGAILSTIFCAETQNSQTNARFEIAGFANRLPHPEPTSYTILFPILSSN